MKKLKLYWSLINANLKVWFIKRYNSKKINDFTKGCLNCMKSK